MQVLCTIPHAYRRSTLIAIALGALGSVALGGTSQAATTPNSTNLVGSLFAPGSLSRLHSGVLNSGSGADGGDIVVVPDGLPHAGDVLYSTNGTDTQGTVFRFDLPGGGNPAPTYITGLNQNGEDRIMGMGHDGSALFVGDQDRDLWRIDLATGAVTHQAQDIGGSGFITDVIIAPANAPHSSLRGRGIAATENDVVLFDPANLGSRVTVEASVAAWGSGNDNVTNLAKTPDGTILAVTRADGSLVEIDQAQFASGSAFAQTREIWSSTSLFGSNVGLKGLAVNHVTGEIVVGAVGRDELVLVSADGSQSQVIVSDFTLGNYSHPHGLAFSADGDTLYMLDRVIGGNSNRFEVWGLDGFLTSGFAIAAITAGGTATIDEAALTVALDASGSSDPANAITGYSWTGPDGTLLSSGAATVQSAALADLIGTDPGLISQPGQSANLTVSADALDGRSGTATVTATYENAAPSLTDAEIAFIDGVLSVFAAAGDADFAANTILPGFEALTLEVGLVGQSAFLTTTLTTSTDLTDGALAGVALADLFLDGTLAGEETVDLFVRVTDRASATASDFLITGLEIPVPVPVSATLFLPALLIAAQRRRVAVSASRAG